MINAENMPCQGREARLFTMAIQLFSQHGTAISETDIAAAAGIDQAALRRDYPTREDLFNAIYLRIHYRVCGMLRDRLVPGDSLHARVRALWDAYIAWAVAHPDCQRARHRLMVSDLLTEQTRRSEMMVFPDISILEAAAECDIFADQPPEFGEAIFCRLVEDTVGLMLGDPLHAAAYRQAGFETYWRIFFE